MKKENIELYVSEDIIQGENVPFYILCDRDDITCITLEFDGFSSIVMYHNVTKKITTKENKIKINDIKPPHYLGGILKDDIFNTPYQSVFLKIKVELDGGKNVGISGKENVV